MKKVLILVLGLSLTAASCSLLGSTGPKGALKSEDGGQTFTASNALEKKGDIGGVNVNSFSMDPNDSDVLYIGSASGVYKTTNAAETWHHLLTGMRIGDLAIDPSRSDIVYAVGISDANGRVVKTTDSGSTWRDIYTEPTKDNAVLSVAISRATSKVLLIGLGGGEIIRSIDEGATWQIVKDLGNPVLDLEYTDNSTVYALTLNSGIYKSTDQGSNWLPVSIDVAAVTTTPVTDTNTPGTIRYSGSGATRNYSDMAFDQRLPGVIFVAADKGLIRTVDNGTTWTLVSLPVLNESLVVSAVAINPTNSNNLYITVGSTLLKSNNGGVTWETRKLPTEQRVKHILINPEEPNKIYLGMGDK